jgi:hypothetical protein
MDKFTEIFKKHYPKVVAFLLGLLMDIITDLSSALKELLAQVLK